MSAVACAPAPEEDDERINTLVQFGRYLIDTKDHLLRMIDLIADGDEALRADLLLELEVLWV